MYILFCKLFDLRLHIVSSSSPSLVSLGDVSYSLSLSVCFSSCIECNSTSVWGFHITVSLIRNENVRLAMVLNVKFISNYVFYIQYFNNTYFSISLSLFLTVCSERYLTQLLSAAISKKNTVMPNRICSIQSMQFSFGIYTAKILGSPSL